MSVILRQSAIALLCAAIVFWIAGPVLMQPGWYYSHDAWYPYRASQFSSAFKEGFWYPRWMGSMLGGNGYPTFVYYQPGFFFLTLPFTYVTDVLTSCKIAIFLALYVGMLGAYRFAHLWHPRWLSLCLATIFIFSRYIITNLSIRGDLSELMAMLILPWSLYFLFRVAQTGKHRLRMLKPLMGLSLTSALIVISHPLVAAMWFPFVAGVLLCITLPRKDWRTCIAGVLCLAIGITLSSPYWFTFLQMKDLVNIEGAPTRFAEFLANFNSAHHLLDNSDQSIYFVQEYWYFFTALAGFGLFWYQWPMAFGFIIYLAYSLMMTGSAIPVWEAGFAVLCYLQFDWRLLAPIVTIRYIGLVMLGLPLMHLYGKGKNGARLAVMLALLATGLVIVAERDLFSLGWPVTWKTTIYSLDYTKLMPQIERTSLVYANGNNEFLPKTANFNALTNRLVNNAPVVSLPDDEGTLPEISGNDGGMINIRAKLKKDASLVIHQLYFPGWKVLVDGNEVAPTPTTEGLIGLQLKGAGEHRITAWYDGPPHWQIRNGVILALLVVLLALLRKTLKYPVAQAQPAPAKPEAKKAAKGQRS